MCLERHAHVLAVSCCSYTKKTEKILSICQKEVELNLECWSKNLKAFSIQPFPDLHLFKNC